MATMNKLRARYFFFDKICFFFTFCCKTIFTNWYFCFLCSEFKILSFLIQFSIMIKIIGILLLLTRRFIQILCYRRSLAIDVSGYPEIVYWTSFGRILYRIHRLEKEWINSVSRIYLSSNINSIPIVSEV